MNEQAQLLEELMKYEFSAIDLNLYLDTHPNDAQALNHFNSLTRRIAMIRKTYQRDFGPLLNYGFCPSQYPWRWVNDPWPWEVEF